MPALPRPAVCVQMSTPDRSQRTYSCLVTMLRKAIPWIVVAIVLLPLLFIIEASVGHDGLLCELGFDMDGAGTGDTGCG